MPRHNRGTAAPGQFTCYSKDELFPAERIFGLGNLIIGLFGSYKTEFGTGAFLSRRVSLSQIDDFGIEIGVTLDENLVRRRLVDDGFVQNSNSRTPVLTEPELQLHRNESKGE